LAPGYKREKVQIGSRVIGAAPSFEVMMTVESPSVLDCEEIEMAPKGLLPLGVHGAEVWGRVRGRVDDTRTETHPVRLTEGP
jgi:hypothetical protein